MKQLLLIRHAKSSWDDAAINDIDRPLNDRGKKDAPKMAERLLDKKVKIDGFYSSPAKRALTTCKLFVKAYDKKEKNIIECVYKANWNLHGKKAGPIRNKEMCHENQDATLVAFPGGKGTANCIQEATCIGMNIIKVKYEQSAG